MGIRIHITHIVKTFYEDNYSNQRSSFKKHFWGINLCIISLFSCTIFCFVCFLFLIIDFIIFSLPHRLHYPCWPGMIKCDDGKQCIFDSLSCDGRLHCEDGSDEFPENCRGKIRFGLRLT